MTEYKHYHSSNTISFSLVDLSQSNDWTLGISVFFRMNYFQKGKLKFSVAELNFTKEEYISFSPKISVFKFAYNLKVSLYDIGGNFIFLNDFTNDHPSVI